MKKDLQEFSHLESFINLLGDINFESNSKDNVEIEVKVNLNNDNGKIYPLLSSVGAEYVSSKYERNFLYDFKTDDNRKNGVVVRVRRQREILTGDQDIFLTLKKNLNSQDNFKRQLELETKFEEENLDVLDNALNSSEMSPKFVYEKFRHTFVIVGVDAEILIDVLPNIGKFLEIEGEEKEINKVLELLNIDKNEAKSSSYISLLKSSKNKNKIENEYRFTKEEAFDIAGKEMEFIIDNWEDEEDEGEHSCSGHCSCCHGHCHSHSEEE